MIGYFQNFPIISYDLTGNSTNNPILLRNIFFRLKIRDAIKKNSLVYYPYYVKEGDTPEIIASKYYKDAEKHWLVMMANDIVDPQFDWPLDYSSFITYMNRKYSTNTIVPNGLEVAQETIHHYEMTISRTDSGTGITTDTVVQIDEHTYDTTPNRSFDNFDINGLNVAVTTATSYVSVFDHELNLNEAKKHINLISKDYLSQIEEEFMRLAN
jgi:hypothetical protein